MAVYPVWWDTTVTIYNRYENPLTHAITWYRHVVNGCFWKDTGNKITVGNTVLETNDIICRIPEQSNFVTRDVWVAKTNDAKKDFLTLGHEDILIKGSVEDVIDEYTAGSRSSDLLSKYKALQGCMQVNAFSINTGAGRGEPHYYVRGV